MIDVLERTLGQVADRFSRSASTIDGYFGLRTAGARSSASYTRLTVLVPSGSHTSLVVFAGLWASGDTWLQLDDASVTAT